MVTNFYGGILISIINSVKAMANTPSQKVSNLEFGFESAIFHKCQTPWFVSHEPEIFTVGSNLKS